MNNRNWIISKSRKLQYHTNLNVLLSPILSEIKGFKWLLSDIEFFSGHAQSLPINHEQDYFVLSSEQFSKLLEPYLQIVWGVILGFPNDCLISVDAMNLPYAEGIELIWKAGNIQHIDALIEIVCFDSGYAIVKFKDEEL